MDSDNDSGYACDGVCCWVDSVASDSCYLGDGQSKCSYDEQYMQCGNKFGAVVVYSDCGCFDCRFYDYSEGF